MVMITILNLFPVILLATTGLPDPTRPADYVSIPENIVIEELPEELIDWNVTAIRIAGSDRSAIVNGRLVREGDEIGPAKILEIQPISIVLDYNETQVVVRLFNNMVQKKMREKQ
ncbi:MAG: hypothetical protein HW411_1627 [Gammaproteobacteria bacterium]|nr:hypothetical protein [Gammaproteobacteria bacterium]